MLSRASAVDWSSFYAAVPIMRTVLTREPFSWLLSKHAWHGVKLNCSGSDVSWIDKFALEYVIHLCGEDCAGRLAERIATIEELEAQADSNLRQAFAIVGVLDKMQDFNFMFSKRFAYFPDYTQDVDVKYTQGRSHKSPVSKESRRCKVAYADPQVRRTLAEKSSGLRMLLRIHNTSKVVSQHHHNELSQCPP